MLCLISLGGLLFSEGKRSGVYLEERGSSRRDWEKKKGNCGPDVICEMMIMMMMTTMMTILIIHFFIS